MDLRKAGGVGDEQMPCSDQAGSAIALPSDASASTVTDVGAGASHRTNAQRPFR